MQTEKEQAAQQLREKRQKRFSCLLGLYAFGCVILGGAFGLSMAQKPSVKKAAIALPAAAVYLAGAGAHLSHALKTQRLR